MASAVDGIEQCDFYHGLLPRQEVIALLTNHGNFLLRKTKEDNTNKMCFVLSVNWEGQIRHILANEKHGEFSFDGKIWTNSIAELVRRHQQRNIPVVSNVLLLNQVPKQTWELHRKDITLGEKIGKGQFGIVYSGTLAKGNKHINIAIKTVQSEQFSKDEIKTAMAEARIMRDYRHPNIVRFYGIVADEAPLLMIMELVNGGTLKEHLSKHGREMQPKQKVALCIESARGIAFLHDKGCIHRDIAARNCLLHDGHAKIADFGLSRHVVNNIYKATTEHEKMPIRWLAPECMRKQLFSIKSDVFSFGILCWEIFSNGCQPYPDIAIQDLPKRIINGYRMTFPSDTPVNVVSVVNKCWHNDMFARPTMHKVIEMLTNDKTTSNDSRPTCKSLQEVTPSAAATSINKTSSSIQDGKNYRRC